MRSAFLSKLLLLLALLLDNRLRCCPFFFSRSRAHIAAIPLLSSSAARLASGFTASFPARSPLVGFQTVFDSSSAAAAAAILVALAAASSTSLSLPCLQGMIAILKVASPTLPKTRTDHDLGPNSSFDLALRLLPILARFAWLSRLLPGSAISPALSGTSIPSACPYRSLRFPYTLGPPTFLPDAPLSTP